MIVSTETGGLGNRIKSWVSAMRLDSDYRVHWPVTANMPATFEQLFANECAIETLPAGVATHKSWRLSVLPEDEPHLPKGFATVGGGAHPLLRGAGKLWWMLMGRRTDRYRYMVFPKQHSRRSSRADARHLDLEYGRIPEYFRAVYGAYFGRIEPLPAIQRRVDEYARGAFHANVIGVQIRTWRDDPRRHRKYHVPAVKRLAKLLDAAASQDKFFVVSDSDEIVVELRAAYGESRVLCFDRHTSRNASWQSVEGISEDLIDMLLLARTTRFYASYLSTFSEAAWWLGGAKADVSVF